MRPVVRLLCGSRLISGLRWSPSRQRDHRPGSRLPHGRLGPRQRLSDVGLVHDPVAPVHRRRLVAADLHRHRLAHPSFLHVADRRPPKVVEEDTADSGGLTRRAPRLAEIGDRPTGPMEDERRQAGTPIGGSYWATRTRRQGLRGAPSPFVLVRALGDFSIIYEINAYSRDPQAMNRQYAALHRNILDVFNEYGVQIMTLGYEGDPPEPKVVARERLYAAPAVSPPA